MKVKITFFIIATLLLSGCISNIEKSKVVKIIDGDTIKLENGMTVRLLGINAPERGQKYYNEAKRFLEKLVYGKEVILERDSKNRDQYGRYLRYLILNESNVNVLLIKKGLASPYLKNSMKYSSEIKKAWSECLKRKINLCNISDSKCSNCIIIKLFHYNAEGNDCRNLNDEYIIFKNICNFPCNLTNWKVEDESSRKGFIFPEFMVNASSEFTLYTGCGKNENSRLYWCSSGKMCNAIWNNDRDTLFLYDNYGNLALNYSYININPN